MSVRDNATATATATASTTNMIPPEEAHQQVDALSGLDEQLLKRRYASERTKRLRDTGNDQYVDIGLSTRFQSFLEDPWTDVAAVKDAQTQFPNNRCHFLIFGAGFGGLLYAVRMIQAGIQPNDIRIVDIAAGFGGTWYWNRYPGLACDIESYCYLPLLEETGYVPRDRYASGEEIRNYAEMIAKRWGLVDSAVFQTKAESLVWDEEEKEWRVELVQHRERDRPRKVEIRSRFVATVNGVLNWPKLPGIPGILDYRGDIFHSSRWDYALTGGSPTDPSLKKLQGKRVAIIGTGATAVQIVPHLALWAKHLYIVQRTPASVDYLDQRQTDTDRFQQEVATQTGWQRARMKNFHEQLTTEKEPAINLVNDGWTRAVGMVAIAGNPSGPDTINELPAYIENLHSIDMPRQERIRKRVEEDVQDAKVAESLKPWYPTWCKRPAFSSSYLSTFNLPNVTLVDTGGKGLDQITHDSIVAGDRSYPVDVIICATGFRAPFTGSPAQKANMTIIGRNGISMSEEWAKTGPSTLHGVLDTKFPNLFLSGPWQASLSPNNLFNIDVLAKQASYILANSLLHSQNRPCAVSPTAAASEEWGRKVLIRSPPMAAIAGCTPSYFNVEGAIDRATPDTQMQMARSGLWGGGIEEFVGILDRWREEGGMWEDVEIEVRM